MTTNEEFAGLPEQHQNKTVVDTNQLIEKRIASGTVIHINGLPFELVEGCLVRSTKGNIALALPA